MKKLNKLLLREIFVSKAQFLAAAAVIFSGVCIFIATGTSYNNLKNSVDYYYEEYNFLDYYAQTAENGISKEIINEIKEIEGVSKAVGRLSTDVVADMGTDSRIVLRMISVPDSGNSQINDLHVVEGEGLGSSEASGNSLLSQKFADYHKLKPGSKISFHLGEKAYSMNISGIANSPEFIYALRSLSSLVPSDEEFGIMYVKESDYRRITGANTGFNQVHLIFEEYADAAKIKKQLREQLSGVGYVGDFERKELPSYVMIEDDINSMKDLSTVVPVLFLGVAAAMIYVMQRRVIGNQRIQIGTFKALGYSNARILMHFMLFSVLVSLAGAVPAAFAGVAMGGLMTKMYSMFYTLASLDVEFHWELMGSGIALSTLLCLLGSFSASKRILKLIPAQAMRPEAPKAGKRILLERVKFFWRPLPFGWKVSIRNIFRNKQRTFLTVSGFVITVTLVLAMMCFLDTINYMLDSHFNKFMKYDYKISFDKPWLYDDVKQLKAAGNMEEIQPIVEVPAEIEKDGIKKEFQLIVMDRGNRLYGLKDSGGNDLVLPDKGIIMAEGLAERLNIKAGDEVELKIYSGAIEKVTVSVAGLNKQLVGFNCYMSYDEAFKKDSHNPKFSTSALINAEKGKVGEVKRTLIADKRIEGIEDRSSMYGVFKSFMGFVYIFIGFMLVFSLIMGFGIIFNTTVINLMERKRELASLKVLGYSRFEIGNTILRENIILGMAAILPGVLLGSWLSVGLLSQMNKEVMTLEAHLSPLSFVVTVVCVFVFIFLAQLANIRNISRLDMVESLKSQE